ncbi:hypothetical protein RJ53_06635 [Methanocalculus chunghsingensis]|uniref:Uncharacterized protein n=1 Tax=Methanocalculus chunghsingensis TaxID=156457 RepID=A0A8J7W7N4_9EURY|nr:hypothetical protein [Methanocalculus chunghsingensis]MBR1369186.1 hypothetical protein [Methanocalculus chunghsingensis]
MEKGGDRIKEERAQLPEAIRRFIARYTRSGGYQSVLIPWVGDFGSYLPLFDEIGATRLVAITEHAGHPEREGVHLIEGGTDEVLSGCNERFDLIIAVPPIERPDPAMDARVQEKQIINPDNEERTAMLIRAGGLLSHNGVLFCITDPDFFAGGKNAGILKEHGLFPQAAFSLPRGVFPPVAGRRRLLVIIRQGEEGRMMAGELSPEDGRQEILMQNLLNGTEGKTAQHGRFISPFVFRSLGEILLEDEVQKLAEEQGTAAVPFSGLARSITIGACGLPQDAGRRLYLPYSPAIPPATRDEDIAIAPGETACILLRPDAVDPGYLILFFTTPLGHAIRELIARRAGDISRFRETLSLATIYLPAPQVQAEVLRIHGEIESLKQKLDSIGEDLLNHPHSSRSALERMKNLMEGDGLHEWTETLPFPLASIIWAYIAEDSPEKKQNHLFHLFEASAEFLSLILISGIAPLTETEEIDLLDENPEFRDIYRYATFRSWIILCRRTGRFVRKRLASPEERDEIMALFGNPPRGFIDLITDKRLFTLFDEVADLRNDWKGHGGIVSIAGYEERLATLEEYLKRYQRIVRDHFTDVTLVIPGSGEYRDGIFTYKADALMGSRSRFRTIHLQTRIPLDTGKVYLHAQGSSEPLELLPLFRLERHPKTGAPAWYFYNRIDGRSVRWISYHYEASPEFEEENDEVYQTMKRLLLISGE